MNKHEAGRIIRNKTELIEMLKREVNRLQLQEKRREDRKGIYLTEHKNGKVLAIDSRTGDFNGFPWVEDFDSMEEALNWAMGKDETKYEYDYEYHDFEPKKRLITICPKCGENIDLTEHAGKENIESTCTCGLKITAHIRDKKKRELR